MKKKLLTVLTIAGLFMSVGFVNAKSEMSSELSEAINMYKKGNYTECYANLTQITANSMNPVAYYYMAMSSAQLGKRDEAIENYEKTMSLISMSSNLYRFAEKGKRCLETPEKCDEESLDNVIEDFVRNKKARFSEQVQNDYEKLKINDIMKEMNRSNDINPQRFKEYKDFSSYNNLDTPSNDEIVAAIRTLKSAGLYNETGLLNNFGLGSELTAMSESSAMNSQLIQSMLTKNMLLGF